MGEVVAAGPGAYDEDLKAAVPLDVAAGATVLFSKYAGAEFEGTDGKEYTVIRESDILAVHSA